MLQTRKSLIDLSVILTSFLLAFPLLADATNLHFYIVAKNQADMNFQRVLQGCNKQARDNGDQCFLAGPQFYAQAEDQYRDIKQLLSSKRVDGLAISVIDSALVRSAIEFTSIPVITFDSPLVSSNSTQTVPTHIGVDDEEVGRKLAELAMEDRPQGGTLCILSDNDPNLASRVRGVRLQLSHETNSRKLAGENGWREAEKCPWMTGDSAIRIRNQLRYTLETIKPNVLISVGHWPVYFPEIVDWMSDRYLSALVAGKPYLYSAIGYKAPSFSKLLENGYVRGYVEINFEEQGRLIYQTLLAYSKGEHHTEAKIFSKGVLVHHSLH